MAQYSSGISEERLRGPCPTKPDACAGVTQRKEVR